MNPSNLSDTIKLLESLRNKRNFCRHKAKVHPNIMRALGYAEAAHRLNKKLWKLLMFQGEEE